MASRGTVSIVGVPFSGGQPRGGVDLGPKYLRDAGLHEAIRAQNWDVRDIGDVALPPQNDDDVLGIAKRPRYVGGTCENLRDAVLAEIKTDNFVLVVGGDHSIAAGSISAVLENDPETCIVWIDAHSDINTIDTTHTGNIHGMPVSFLMNLTNMRSLPGFEWMANSPVLRPDRIAYIGLRDVDEGEKVILREKNILAFSMNDVDRLGIVKVMENVMQHLNADGSRRIHLSLDVDGIDTLHTPATGTPVPGGLSLREGRYICETLFQTGHLKSMDVVEINPQLSDQHGIDSTLSSSLLLIKTALGRSLLKN